jgi:hypothetical protein
MCLPRFSVKSVWTSAAPRNPTYSMPESQNCSARFASRVPLRYPLHLLDLHHLPSYRPSQFLLTSSRVAWLANVSSSPVPDSVPEPAYRLGTNLDHALKHKVFDSGYAKSLGTALNEGACDAVADGIVQMFGNQREVLQSFLQQYFQETGPIASGHQLLQQIPFSSVITTNYDRLLEQAFSDYATEGLFTPKGRRTTS